LKVERIAGKSQLGDRQMLAGTYKGRWLCNASMEVWKCEIELECQQRMGEVLNSWCLKVV
jgi:hypothetical protein